MKSSGSYASTQVAKHEFDLLHPPKKSRIEVRQATVNDVKLAYEFSKDKIPNSTTDISLVKKIISHNSNNIFLFLHNDSLVGLYAMLMLSPVGLERLLLGELDSKKPDLICLSKTEEVPAAIYVWSYIAPGLAADGIRHVCQFLLQPKYRNINFFARPVTEAGMKITLNLGYQPVLNGNGGLYRYVRLANRELNLQHAA